MVEEKGGVTDIVPWEPNSGQEEVEEPLEEEELEDGIQSVDSLSRTGGKENYFHCNKCGCCYSNMIQYSHPCVGRAMHHNCPVCFEGRNG
ncbi:hypothetical protein RHMOL_Rhmol06G0132100 [Rhododendron molle]|uniref:Uncharacterized protein n=1 Tax=Rhododendron molle TaxID=49168 RepID=A0ACC0NBQ2_RHOML|nr:hypothetical protein RHMOL_Rhmol06G0132100 [Rhododendron molle]